MLGSRLHLTFLALSYLHGSLCRTIFLLLVVLGEVQASNHWARPSPVSMSEAIWGGGLALSNHRLRVG